MRVPKTPAESTEDRQLDTAARVHQREHALVGWFHIYGSSPSAQASLRAGRDGKVLVSPSGRLGVDPITGLEITGFAENSWVGLSLLHGLFALEHNAICGELKQHNPLWDDERLFQQARLVNAALLAKIHTVDWTRAILTHPALQVVMNADWWGLAGEQVKKSSAASAPTRQSAASRARRPILTARTIA